MTIEEIQQKIEAINRKDKFDDNDWHELSALSKQLKELKGDGHDAKEEVKDIYNEMIHLIMDLYKPNGRWKSNSTKEWAILKRKIIAHIIYLKIKGGENGSRS